MKCETLRLEPAVISLRNVSKTYQTGKLSSPILHGIDLDIAQGRTHAILGGSGSGKSTLLTLMGLLDTPTSGQVLLQGQDVGQAPKDALATLRNQLIGFVFQAFHLLPRLSALDNVALPLRYRGMPPQDARELARAELARVDLSQHLDHRPAELSGGQCQRVAIARALVGKPLVILADEPTGSLDSKNASAIMDLLLSLNQSEGMALAVVTHDTRVAARLETQILVKDGTVSISAPIPPSLYPLAHP